jgi:hypothetical protein
MAAVCAHEHCVYMRDTTCTSHALLMTTCCCCQQQLADDMVQQAKGLLGIDLLSGRQAVKLSIGLAHVLTVEVHLLHDHGRYRLAQCKCRGCESVCLMSVCYSSMQAAGLVPWQKADWLGFRPAQGKKRMEQRRCRAAVSILDDAYRLLNGLADREEAEHTTAATAALQSRVGIPS